MKLRHCVKFRQNRSNSGRDIAIFRFFDFSRWRPPPSWILKNLKILTVGRLKRVAVRRHAKFGRNRSNSGRDMAIIRFSKMAAAAILDFQNFKFSTVGGLKSVELRRLAKFGRNRSKHGRDRAIYRFFKMAAAAILNFQFF